MERQRKVSLVSKLNIRDVAPYKNAARSLTFLSMAGLVSAAYLAPEWLTQKGVIPSGVQHTVQMLGLAVSGSLSIVAFCRMEWIEVHFGIWLYKHLARGHR